MAERLGTWVEAAAVGAVANGFTAAAQSLDHAARNLLTRLAFDGGYAGHAHAARGDALRAALDGLAGDLARWSRAVNEIAVTLRSGAGSYLTADLRSAERIG